MPRRDLDLKEQIGLNQIMWGSDFHHPEGTWPNTADYFAETFAGFPVDEGKAILGGNATKFYGMDEGYLRTIADEIGPEISIFNQ